MLLVINRERAGRGRRGEGRGKREERRREGEQRAYIPAEIVFECFIICSGSSSTLVNGVSDDGTNLWLKVYITDSWNE